MATFTISKNASPSKSNHRRAQLLPTLDRPLQLIFGAFTRHLLVDYYFLFIIGPILLTAFLGCGFLWLQELTILDAKKLYTPGNAPSWREEAIFSDASATFQMPLFVF
jgi:hypothetical protein